MSTRLRSMRIDDDLWGAAQDRAAEEGTNVTAIVVALLKQYVED